MRTGRGTTLSRGFARSAGSVGDLRSHGVGESPSWPHRGLVGALMVAGLAVAGCTPDPGPTPSASPSAVVSPAVTPTPTPTPTPDASVKPERPAAMDEVSTAGAEAVAVYFLQLFPYVYATGDLEDWQGLSHAECTFCTGVTDEVGSMSVAGQHAEGGGFEVTASRVREVTPGSWYAVEFEMVQSPSTTVDSSGAIVEEFPETKVVWVDAAVVREEGRWLIREMTPREVD